MNDRVAGMKSEFTPQLDDIKAMVRRTWRRPVSGSPMGEQS